MAFISGLPVTTFLRHHSPSILSSHSTFTTSTSVLTTQAPRKAQLCMQYVEGGYVDGGNYRKKRYGDYDYGTDKTQGHLGNYYIDKARTGTDFATRRAPRDEGATFIGRDTKGRIAIPKEGIPQEIDDILLPDKDEDRMVDPRTAEAEGTVYSWDPAYVNPSFTDGLTDIDDEEAADREFARFRGLMSTQRGQMLTQLDRGLSGKIEEINAGFDEDYKLTVAGQWDMEYARLQKIKNYDTGDYVGALDFMKMGNAPRTAEIVDREEKLEGFWKESTKQVSAAPSYRRPSGANEPELPYNTGPPIPALIEQSRARGIGTSP